MYVSKSQLLVCIFILTSVFFYSCQSITKKSNTPELNKKVSIADARIVLRHFVNGTIPEYQEFHAAKVQPTPEILSHPEFCFSRCRTHDMQECDSYAIFKENTEAFIIPFAKAVHNQELTEKSFLDEHQTVEKWVYEDHWEVVVNFGEEDYLYERTLIPQFGFIAIGPHYIAQHYYPNAKEKHTRLYVKYEDQEYTGFE